MSSPPSSTNKQQPFQFRSLKDKLRFDHNQATIVASEKDDRRKLESFEKRILDNLFDNLVRSNISEMVKNDERSRLCAREMHFRLSIEEERIAWCSVVEELMTQYERSIIVSEREKTGEWKSMRIVRTAVDENDENGDDENENQDEIDDEDEDDDDDGEETSLIEIKKDEFDDFEEEKIEQNKISNSPPSASNIHTSKNIASLKREHQFERGRPNPFGAVISRPQVDKDKKNTKNNNNSPNPQKQSPTSPSQLPEIVKKRIDEMLFSHGRRNDAGTSVVERTADKRKMEQISLARIRKEVVMASSIMRTNQKM